MKWADRWLILGAIALLTLVLLTLFAAPASNPANSGSTFNRDPDGYGAWYSFMQERGTPVQRWQKPILQLIEPEASQAVAPITLLRVNSTLESAIYDEAWIKKGNTLVVLGIRAPATEARFVTQQTSPAGLIEIHTKRRHQLAKGEKMLLGDRFGAIVWQKSIGDGNVIFSTTRHLAANAFQDTPGNYAFLAQLMTQTEQARWVDEYSHGYRDTEAIASEASRQSLSEYLGQTPLFPVCIQIGGILLVLIWSQNRRFGMPALSAPPEIDNSKAYIQALSQVLEKAECGTFVVDVIRKEEQLQIQRALGLGLTPLEVSVVLQEWTLQTGRPASELAAVIQPARKRQLSDRDLLLWIEQIQTVRRHLPQASGTAPLTPVDRA